MKSTVGQGKIQSPFVYTGYTSLKTNTIIIIMLCFQFLVLFLLKDFTAVIHIICSILGTVFCDCVISYIEVSKPKISLETIIYGLLIGFCMPVEISSVYIFFVSGFSVFITQKVFGGKGTNCINPVAASVCMAFVSRPDNFPKMLNRLETVKQSGSFFSILENSYIAKLQGDSSITSILNSVFLHKAGVTLPENYVSLFFNSGASIPAFRYNIITLLLSVILFALFVTDYVLPFTFLFVYGVLVWVFALVPVTGVYFSGDILSALLTSGALFAAFFIMTESSSMPKTKYGKIIAGILCGTFAFFICGLGASSAGIFFSILLTNIMSPVIERIEIFIQLKKRKIYE